MKSAAALAILGGEPAVRTPEGRRPGLSPEADRAAVKQLLALREYASRRGFSIYKEYVDHVSGDAGRARRPS